MALMDVAVAAHQVSSAIADVAAATPTPSAGGFTVPDPAPVAPPGVGPAVDTLLGWLKWGGLVSGFAGLLICAMQMMLGRRNRSAMAADGAAGIPWVFGGLTLVAFAAALVGAVA